MSSKHFHALIQECIKIHDKKNADYAQDDNPFSNFERAATLVDWFNKPIDQVFACMVGIKLARLAELRNGKTPNNESIRDSHMDLINYAALWGAYWDEAKSKIDELEKHNQRGITGGRTSWNMPGPGDIIKSQEGKESAFSTFYKGSKVKDLLGSQADRVKLEEDIKAGQELKGSSIFSCLECDYHTPNNNNFASHVLNWHKGSYNHTTGTVKFPSSGQEVYVGIGIRL